MFNNYQWQKLEVTETQYMSTVTTIPLYANSATIYYSTYFCIGYNKRKIYLYKKSYATSYTFITIKYKIIRQSDWQWQNSKRSNICIVWDLKCEIGVSLEGVSEDAGLMDSWRCGTRQTGPTFWRNAVPPSSESHKVQDLLTLADEALWLCETWEPLDRQQSYSSDGLNHKQTDFV